MDYLILAGIVLLCVMAAILMLFLWEIYNAVQNHRHFSQLQDDLEEREQIVRRMQR